MLPDMTIVRTNLLMFLLLFHVLLPLSGDVAAVEKVPYRVLEKEGTFELREYAPYIVAETTVEGDFETAGNEGFRRLFKYISGENQTKQSISMTAPVAQERTSEKIPMTAPVNLQQVGSRWRVTFAMPATYTIDTLPGPNDARIVLREIPAQRVAALRYSGTWSRVRYEEHRELLVRMVTQKKLHPAGDYTFARYNPPFMPWFLRRNEVLVPVQN